MCFAGSEPLLLKNRSLMFQSLRAKSAHLFLLSFCTLLLCSCGPQYYKFPQYTFANRPIPPSQLANRVMVSVSANGATGALTILDAKRDIRGNVPNTIRSFAINGYSSGYPNLILNFPEQVRGYVYSDSDGSLFTVNYGTETATAATTGSNGTKSSSVAVSQDFLDVYLAQETTGQLIVSDSNPPARSYALNLPGVYKVAVNRGNSVILAMVRNSNALYRVVRLNSNQPFPPGAVDCQPYNLPVFCVVPVSGAYDRPVDAYFSVDGSVAYLLNCGPECGGATASVSVLQQAPLNYRVIPTVSPEPSPIQTSILTPGGATVALANSDTLFVAGQQQLPDGLFTGRLTRINLTTNAVTGAYGVSDGYHSKLLFADDATLWVGSQFCAGGERAQLGQNTNCLTRFDLKANTGQIIPAVSPPSGQTVPYPNDNLNPYYYGSLTGLCWVEGLHKVYTAYGGQVHAFSTVDGSEINNFNITVQGNALDVAYLDATTNAAN